MVDGVKLSELADVIAAALSNAARVPVMVEADAADGTKVISFPELMRAAAASIAWGEVATGPYDGDGVDYELAAEPYGAFLLVYLNGMLLAVGDDYLLSGSTITLADPPGPGEIVSCVYVK